LDTPFYDDETRLSVVAPAARFDWWRNNVLRRVAERDSNIADFRRQQAMKAAMKYARAFRNMKACARS